MALTTQDQILIEQRVTNDAKSVGVAYLLWFFTGGLGGHRFYLNRTLSALCMLSLFILGWLTIIIGVGLVFFLALGLWALVDAFLIPGLIDRQKAATRQRLTLEALAVQREQPDQIARIEGRAASTY